MTTASPSAWSPDWSAITERIACPLCDYDLRGLPEARCPECGYRCAWSDLLDPAKRRHEYLFEHHPERNVRSFIRTKLESARPWRFWSTLKPTQPSSARRLLLFWIICVLPMLILPVTDFARFWIAQARQVDRTRSQLLQSYQRRSSSPGYNSLIQQYGSAQNAVNRMVPSPWTVPFMQRCWTLYWQSSEIDIAVACAVGYICWPWVTISVLMLLQVSMKRAQIRPLHVIRCVLYSCDSAVVAAILLFLFLPSDLSYGYVGRLSGPVMFAYSTKLTATVIAVGVFAALTIYKLGFAYRRYLHFPHAWPVAVLSQVVVILVFLIAATNTVAPW